MLKMLLISTCKALPRVNPKAFFALSVTADKSTDEDFPAEDAMELENLTAFSCLTYPKLLEMKFNSTLLKHSLALLVIISLADKKHKPKKFITESPVMDATQNQ